MPSAQVILAETEIDDLFESVPTFVATRSAPEIDDTRQYVRRPMRGLQLKRETFATMSISGPGTTPPVANSSVPFTSAVNFTSNFILQSVSETRVEKFQPITTFGAPYGFFFGEQPRMVSCQAILLNTADFQWEVEWWHNYDNYFRGTQLTNRGARVYLNYDDVVLEGYLTQATTSKGSQIRGQVTLNFTMWVTNATYLVNVGSAWIDPRHLDRSADTAALDFTGIEADGTLGDDYVSITEEVRAANIEAIAGSDGSGLLNALRNGLEAVDDFVDSVGNAIDNALDFLYGRNLVIPVGFAGSEKTAGIATFASGSGFERLAEVDLGGVLDGSSLNIKVPGTITGAAPAAPAERDFYDNTDEYPFWNGVSKSREKINAALQDVFGVGLSGTSRDEQNQMYTEMAEATFSEFGYDITNEEGQYMSDTLRALGRASFAALSYAAMTTGVSQSAASLTIIGGTTGNTNAAEQQAAAEELNS